MLPVLREEPELVPAVALDDTPFGARGEMGVLGERRDASPR